MKKIEKEGWIAIILVILVIAVVVTSIITNINKNKTANEIKIVTNYNDFYTVDSCIYRIITYVNSNDEKSLLLLLDKGYKKDNNIKDTTGLFSEIPDNATFISRKMYYQVINKNLTKYYVYGYVLPNAFYTNLEAIKKDRKEIYFIVYLDKKNSTFSFEPYSGDIFTGGELNG